MNWRREWDSFIIKTMKKYVLILGLCVGMICNYTHAQSVEKESTYALTGKSKRGRLANVEQKANGNYELTYLTKSTAKKAKFEIYTFDKDFNFKNLEQGEVEFEKMKSKFSWFTYKGELYSVDAITLNWNPATSIKLKKKRITYKYDWLLLGYYKKVEVLEKVKPRTESGDKYFAKAYFEDEISGDLYIVAGVAPGLVSKDVMKQNRDLHILKFDWDLNLVGDISIPFEFDQQVAFSQGFPTVDPENPEAKGIDGGCIVFAPANIKGADTQTDKNKGNFTYVEFSKDMKLVGRESFDNPSPGWQIETSIVAPNSSGGRDVYLYGSAAFGKDKYYLTAVQSTKKKSIQLLKASDGKIQYLTESNIEDLASKKAVPPSKGKSMDYNGKQAIKGNYHLLQNGGFLIQGQFFDKDGKGKDLYAIQFDQAGNLVSTYGVPLNSPNKWAYGNHTAFIQKGPNMYLELVEVTGAVDGEQFLYPSITKIETDKHTVSDPLILGRIGKKQTYFVDKSYPRLNASAGELVYFGSDRKGKNIWFCKVKLD